MPFALLPLKMNEGHQLEAGGFCHGDDMREPNIMIHAAPPRMHYVNDFLVPRLKAQGFNNITIWNDSKGLGCLWSYIESLESLPEEGHTWHLQDDVLPDHRFYKWATSEWAQYPGIITGFGCKYFYHVNSFGNARNCEDMFYSFPCMRIPNKVSKNFIDWFNEVKDRDIRIIEKLPTGKYVDYFFKLFIGDNEHEIAIYNFFPNIVEHVDECISGSLVNKQRKKLAKAILFEDVKALADLRVWSEKNSGNR